MWSDHDAEALTGSEQEAVRLMVGRDSSSFG